jgi:hypothetical protein
MSDECLRCSRCGLAVQHYPSKSELRNSLVGQLANHKAPPAILEGLRLWGTKRKKPTSLKRRHMRGQAMQFLKAAEGCRIQQAAFQQDAEKARQIFQVCASYSWEDEEGGFVLFCFVLFCFVLFCFVLFLFVL